METELFRIFLSTLQWKGRDTTTLRVAGGWVRDKLLGKSSNDIDIAIDDQTGVEFATTLNEYLQSLGIESHRLAVIMANPEQSKHIETATVKVLGVPIDFVNLRSETYSEESRIPGITFGTATEDALRRDFTINSLFYNINTRQVEDLTRHGLSDLVGGVVRTPLNPLITFKDDPLRILRAVRFSARFAFSMDDTLVQAARTADVQSAFLSKVSRERVLKELDGMLLHPIARPALALLYIHYLGIYSAVFKMPTGYELSTALRVVSHEPAITTSLSIAGARYHTSSEQLEHWIPNSLACIVWFNLLRCLRATGWEIFHTKTISTRVISVEEQAACISSDNQTRSLYFAAAISGLQGLNVIDHKGREVPLSTALLRDSLKMDTDTLRAVQAVLDCMIGFQHLALTPATFARTTGGLLLRQVRELWREALWLACAEELATQNGAGQTASALPAREVHHAQGLHAACCVFQTVVIGVPTTPGNTTRDETLVYDTIHRYSQLEQRLLALGLDRVWELRPLLDGHQLMQVLGPALKKGPMIGKVMDAQIRWQLSQDDAGRQGDAAIEALASYLREFCASLQ